MPFKLNKFSCRHLSINETWKEEREGEKEEIFSAVVYYTLLDCYEHIFINIYISISVNTCVCMCRYQHLLLLHLKSLLGFSSPKCPDCLICQL